MITQAITMLDASFQRTADTLRAAPTRSKFNAHPLRTCHWFNVVRSPSMRQICRYVSAER